MRYGALMTLEWLIANSVRTEAGCLEWQRARHKLGYGRIEREGRQQYTHRAAWELANGQKIPAGMMVLHLCDNPPCLNPDHLELGDQNENMRQAGERRRIKAPGLRGSQVGTSKLTEAQVAEIRVLLRAGKSIRSTAKAFGMSKRAVQMIQRGATWKHVA